MEALPVPAGHDEEEAGADQRQPLKDGLRIKESQAVACLSCCGILGIGAFIGLIVLLTSIHTLGPEDQVVITAPSGKYVRNGPSTVILAPERKKEFRKAHKLSAREYAVVKNFRTGEIHHSAGPKFLFLGAYEMVDEVKSMVLLMRGEYMRLIDKMTGDERVISGPATIVPKPLEDAPKGIEKAIVLGHDVAVLIQLKTTGMLRLITAGGQYIPEPYEEILETRKAAVLDHKQYAVVASNLDGKVRHVPGPALLQLGAYEKLDSIKSKIVLRKDEYMRLRNKKDGSERVVNGPIALVPQPLEHTLEGKQRATFLDLDTAALVLNRESGQQSLVTKKGVFVPSPYEQVLEKRSLIRILPHERMILRNEQGRISIRGGGTQDSFFLKPYWEIIEMSWSAFSEDLKDGEEQTISKVKVRKIDMRAQKMLFRFIVLTGDNVKLRLDGTIFWQVLSPGLMVNTTQDPSGDVWYRSRSALVAAVSKTTLASFMLSLSKVSTEALQSQLADSFYSDRGIQVLSLAVTRFEVADAATAEILMSIILQTTNNINRLQVQASSDEVNKERLRGDIGLEKKKTELFIQNAVNERLRAEMEGDIEGLKQLGLAQTFIGGLNNTIADVQTRLDLFKHYERIQSQNQMTKDIASGGKRFFLAAQQLDLGLKMEL